jgi:Fur family ferric uptake transcriptional regulator
VDGLTGARAGATRSTRQKLAIAEALAETEAFLTAQQLHEWLSRHGNRVGLATVYRGLQSLAAAGKVDVLQTPDGEVAYRRCAQGHHHHLVCRGCGRTVEVDGPGVQQWADRLAAEHGFTEVSHVLEVFGTCSSCRAQRGTGTSGPSA